MKGPLRISHLVIGSILMVALGACGSSSSEEGTSKPSVTGPQGTVAKDAPKTSTTVPLGSEAALPTEKATGVPDCQPQQGDPETVICNVTVTNTTESVGEMDTEVAFYGADGTRLDTDGRFQIYVRPDEKYIAQRYGPGGTISAKVLSVSITTKRPPVTGAVVKEGKDELLPVDQVVEPGFACRPEGEDVICDIKIANAGSFTGEIDTEVFFFDAADVRIENDSRYQEQVAPGESFIQTFYGPAGAVRAEVLEVRLTPSS